MAVTVCAVVVTANRLNAVGSAARGLLTWAWATFKGIGALLTASERTSLLLEVAHAHGWKSGGRVMLGSVVVNFVDWHCSVHDMWLYSLLVDNGLERVSISLACEGSVS